MTLAFLITSLIVVRRPGSGALYTVARAWRTGRGRASASVGCTIGIVPAMLAAVTGLAAIMHSSAIAFRPSVGRRWPTAVLAWMAWRDSPSDRRRNRFRNARGRGASLDGVAVTY